MKRTAQAERNLLRGVIAAAITPRRSNEISIDLGATLELIDFLGHSGVNAIALFGSTGEFVHFALDDRRQMTALAAKRSRVPLLVNVSHSTLDGAVELAGDAAASSVAGLLVMPPYYFRYSQDAIRKFFLDFAAAVHGDTPIYLYNVPLFTNEIEISTALSLLDTGRFAGIQDSSGSWEYFTQLRDHAVNKPYTILIGDERLYARARAAGADGVISGVACAAPELVLAIEAAVASGDEERTGSLNGRLAEFTERILKLPAPMGIKEAVRQRRIKSGSGAIDLGGREREQMEEFASWFGPWLAKVRAECAMEMRRRSAS